LILVDAGCEYNCYASDITRTYPLSGKFEGHYKVIYEIVLKAQMV
jgi:Xaa-Pro aminopeptidase